MNTFDFVSFSGTSTTVTQSPTHTISSRRVYNPAKKADTQYYDCKSNVIGRTPGSHFTPRRHMIPITRFLGIHAQIQSGHIRRSTKWKIHSWRFIRIHFMTKYTLRNLPHSRLWNSCFNLNLNLHPLQPQLPNLNASPYRAMIRKQFLELRRHYIETLVHVQVI
jgi:hypothetical protein